MLRTLKLNQSIARTCSLGLKHHNALTTKRTLISTASRSPLFVARAEGGGGGYKQAKDLIKSIEEKQSLEKKKLVSPTSSKPVVKKTMWQKVKDEAVHYWQGTKLLGLEIRISSRLAYKLLQGTNLSRRENRQVRKNRKEERGNILFIIFFFKKISLNVQRLTLFGSYHLLYSLLFHLWNFYYQSH